MPQLEELAESETEKRRVADLVKRKEDYMAGEANRQSDEMISKISDLRAEFGRLRSRGSSSDNRRAIQGLLSTITRVPTSIQGRAKKRERNTKRFAHKFRRS